MKKSEQIENGQFNIKYRFLLGSPVANKIVVRTTNKAFQNTKT